MFSQKEITEWSKTLQQPQRIWATCNLEIFAPFENGGKSVNQKTSLWLSAVLLLRGSNVFPYMKHLTEIQPHCKLKWTHIFRWKQKKTFRTISFNKNKWLAFSHGRDWHAIQLQNEEKFESNYESQMRPPVYKENHKIILFQVKKTHKQTNSRNNYSFYMHFSDSVKHLVDYRLKVE